MRPTRRPPNPKTSCQRPATPCATSRSSPTSTTARRRSSTSCWCRPGTFAKHQHVAERMMDTQRPRARARHHDPRQELLDPLPRHPDQHRRHARPRRLRRRGRARARHGRRRAAAGRRGRGADAADALRHAEGAEARPAPIVVVNKVDRPGARPEWVVNQTFELFDKLGATEEQLDFPVVYASALNGWATHGRECRQGDEPRRRTASMQALFETILARVPQPVGDPDGPLQFQVSALDYSSYVGRLGIGRIRRGRIVPGQEVAILNGPLAEGVLPPKAKIGQVFAFSGHGARAGRVRRGRRHRARHRRRRSFDRHDARVGRNAGGAAADQRRPADAVDVLPGQHVAARRPRRQVRDLAQPARPPREGSADQRRAARRGNRRHRFVPRLGARRAASHDPDREHAARGLRARGVAAARRAARDRRRHLRAVRGADGRRRGSSIRAR